MPAFYPGVQSWTNVQGDFSLPTDQEVLTLPTSPTSQLLFPWHDAATTVASIERTGTATGNMKARTSSANPNDRSDRVLITPGTAEWNAAQYDPALGTLPTLQGWAVGSGTPSVSLSGGRLNYSQSTNSWYERTLALTATKLNIAQYSISIASGGWAGFWWGSPLTTLGRFRIFYDVANTRWFDEVGNVYVGPPMAMTAVSTVTLVARSSNSTALLNGYGELWVNDLFIGAIKGETATQYSIFGGGHNATAFSTTWGSVRFASLVGCDEYGWETITNPDTSFSRNQRYWQLGGVDLANGTLTTLNIASSLTAPSAPSGIDIATISNTALAVDGVVVAAASAYLAQLINTATSGVVDYEYVLHPAHAFRGIASGTYRVDLYSCSDDGIQSATAASSSNKTLPVVAVATPTVTLTVSDSTLSPGDTSGLGYVISGSVDVTLNSSPITGSGSPTIVTGINPSPLPSVTLTVSDDTIYSGQTSALTYAISGAMTATLNGNTITGGASPVIVTGIDAPSPTTAPNQPLVINVMTKPNRPTFVGVL